MVNQLPKQPSKTNQKYNCESFSNTVKKYMKIKGKTQADLTKSRLFSKTTVSRICRNSNDKKRVYTPTIPVVVSISIALNLNREEARELLIAAIPIFEHWGEFLDKKLNRDQVNDILYYNGIDLLGNTDE